MPAFTLPRSRPSHVALTAALFGALVLAGCSGTGGSGGTGLAPGLVAPMDQAGARLDEAAAYSILNQYRATRGVPAFVPDPALTAQAQQLAQSYAASGRPPAVPSGLGSRFSAGYTTFAETFSGWRSSPTDAQALVAGQRAGLAVVYDPNSEYGTHWVLLTSS